MARVRSPIKLPPRAYRCQFVLRALHTPRLSGESAAYQLGAQVISETGVEYSSVSKGSQHSPLEDMLQTVEQYADLIILRHPDTDSATRAAAVLQKPFINAGAGSGEHPTQALLDLFTMREHTGKKRSLIAIPGVSCVEARSLEDAGAALTETDVLYVTRTQDERLPEEERGKYNGAYRVTPRVQAQLSRHAIIMHPFPRGPELPKEVDEDIRARYFQQIKNGLYVRKALLSLMIH